MRNEGAWYCLISFNCFTCVCAFLNNYIVQLIESAHRTQSSFLSKLFYTQKHRRPIIVCASMIIQAQERITLKIAKHLSLYCTALLPFVCRYDDEHIVVPKIVCTPTRTRSSFVNKVLSQEVLMLSLFSGPKTLTHT